MVRHPDHLRRKIWPRLALEGFWQTADFLGKPGSEPAPTSSERNSGPPSNSLRGPTTRTFLPSRQPRYNGVMDENPYKSPGMANRGNWHARSFVLGVAGTAFVAGIRNVYLPQPSAILLPAAIGFFLVWCAFLDINRCYPRMPLMGGWCLLLLVMWILQMAILTAVTAIFA